MADSDILKQIALLNPRIINGNEVDSVNDFILNSGSSSPNEGSQDDTMDHQDDNEILNLWSSTKIFFDPFDSSKINPTTQAQNGVNITSDINKLSEREIDRQRYTRLKQQQQSIYINRGRHDREDNVPGKVNDNNLLNINDFQQLLMSDKNKNDANLMQPSTSTANHQPTIAPTQNFMNGIEPTLNNDNKLKDTVFTVPLDKTKAANTAQGIDNNKKGKDLYSQLLDSINTTTTNKNTKKAESSTIISKTNESRSKEIAEKKKRRSAATMRCRERKKNQLQKKEQYIKYLENQILFLNGSILHMSNEITWLRRSFLDQYGEQSLKNIYMKNGFKDVNFNNVLYPGGSTPSPSSFASSNMLSPDLSINSPDSHPGQSPEAHEESSPALPQHSTFLTPVSSATHNNEGQTPSAPATQASVTELSKANGNNGSSSSQPQSELFKHLDMDTLNEFANLSKEQRDVLLKILEKQQQINTQKPTASAPPPRNYINIANDDSLSKPQSSILSLASTTSHATNTNQFNTISQNIIPFNQQGPFNSYATSIAVAASQPPISSNSIVTSGTHAISMTTTSADLIAFNSTNSTDKGQNSSNIIPTSSGAESTDYINLDNLIYYI